MRRSPRLRPRPVPALALAAATALGAAGCAPELATEGSLEVYLRSDLSPLERSGLRVEVTLWSFDDVELARAALEASSLESEPLAAASGAFLAAFEGLASGLVRVQVSLSGEGVEPRRADTVVAAGAGLTQARVVVAREAARTCQRDADCEPDEPCIDRVLCDSAERRCLRFRAAYWVEGCACEVASDCAPAGGCGVTSCESYSCVTGPDPSRCGPRESCRALGGGEYRCDPATCRGRAAGEQCRPARSACDVPEVCEVGGVDECPPDVGRPAYTGCDGPAGGGYCSLRGDSMGQALDCGPGGERCECRTDCRSGEACRVPGQPCEEGALDCAGGVASCLATGARSDGFACGEPTECAEAPVCRDGECVSGEPRPSGAECGPVVVEGGCFAPSFCDGSGRCVERVRLGLACDRPPGAPAPALCQAYRCGSRGDCLLTVAPDGIDPAGCSGRAPGTTCGVRRCSSGACVTIPDGRLCAGQTCRTGLCSVGRGYQCELASAGAGCTRSDGSTGRCDELGRCL